MDNTTGTTGTICNCEQRVNSVWDEIKKDEEQKKKAYNSCSLEYKEDIIQKTDEAMYAIVNLLDAIKEYNQFRDRKIKDSYVGIYDDDFMLRVKDLIYFKKRLNERVKWLREDA